jgi:hypothetical protein
MRASMDDLAYDDRAAEPLLAALAPGGPLRWVTERVLAGDGLDLQLRRRSADVYAGTARVAEVRLTRDGRPTLRVRGGAELDQAIAATRPQPWPGPGDEMTVVARHAQIAAPRPALAAARIPLDAAVAGLRAEGVRWAVPPFTDRIDALAIDAEGRVLVIAARDGADARRTGWAPAQLAVHFALARRWAGQDTVHAADVLEGQRSERVRLGLLPASAQTRVITRPLEFVPVLVLHGAPSAATARRMARVGEAVVQAGGDLAGLEIARIG